MRQGQQGALPEHGALNSFDASASDVTNCDKAINGLKQMSMDKCTNSQAAQKEQKVALSDITSKYHKVDNRLPIRPLLSAKKNDSRTDENVFQKSEKQDDDALILRHIRVLQGISSIEGMQMELCGRVGEK